MNVSAFQRKLGHPVRQGSPAQNKPHLHHEDVSYWFVVEILVVIQVKSEETCSHSYSESRYCWYCEIHPRQNKNHVVCGHLSIDL